MSPNKIQEYRKEKHMTLTELSVITGLSVGYLCHLENGTRNNPSMKTAEKIARALSKTVSDIFFDK